MSVFAHFFGTRPTSARPTHPRGFTLLELAVVLALITMLAAMGFSALETMKLRSSRVTAVNDVVNGLRRAKAEAMGRGATVSFVIDTAGTDKEGGRWWALEAPSGVDLDAFDPADPKGVIESGTLPKHVFPAAGYGELLDTPLSGIPMKTSQSAKLNYCSFCRTAGTNAGFGVVTFEPGGKTRFSDGPSAVGQQFTLAAGASGTSDVLAVAIVAASGAIHTVEKK